MWNFCLKLWFFRNCLSCRDRKTCSIGFGMPPTLNMHHSSNFDAFFPVKINKMWKFGCFLNSPWQKNWKENVNLHREKVFAKACKCAHVGFWVCWLQCTMLELCVISTFWVIMVFLHLLWEGQDTGFCYMVKGLNGTQGGLLHTSHPIFMVLNPIFCYVSPKSVIFHQPAYHRDSQQVPLYLACLET